MSKSKHTHGIGAAIAHIKDGGRIQRSGWHGKRMSVHLENFNAMQHPCMVLTLPDNSQQPGWNASTPDILADDWALL